MTIFYAIETSMSNPELMSKLHRFESFLKADPSNQMLMIDLVNLYVEAGRVDAAIACLQRPEVEEFKSAKLLLKLANLFVGEKRWKEAQQIYLRLSADGFDSGDFRFALGLTLFYQDQFSDALEQWSLAAQQGMDNPDLWKYCAYSHHHLFQMKEAIEACLRWTNLSEHSLASRNYLCFLYFDANFMQEACAIATELLNEDSNSLVGHTVMGSFALENHQPDTARAHFTQAIAHPKDAGRAWLGLGLTHLYLQQHADAVTVLQRAEIELPTHSGTVITLAWVFLMTNQFVEAEARFRRAIEIDRNFAEAHGGLASVLVQLGKIDEAKAEMSIAIKLDAQCFGVVYARAALLQQEGKFEAADSLFKRTLERSARQQEKSMNDHLQAFLIRSSKTNRE